MSVKLIECIPNFSEGRRIEVVNSIVDAITSVAGIVLLDRSSDTDHNRSVVTYAGCPERVVEAAFRGIAEAAQRINLETHRGVHPRIGATDVVPFVPLRNITLEDCVQLAQQLGDRVGRELSIPVYLYEAAATRPERQRLENIRRGQYESLKAKIGDDSQYTPDFGPSLLGAPGATVIGARNPLIAFNAYLTTDDVKIAKVIARTIRQSSGGLPAVKALGVLVGGQAQVSINLTDYKQTPLPVVVEAIRRGAVQFGVQIERLELIGLIPQAAVGYGKLKDLQMDWFSTEKILEFQIERKLRESKSQGRKDQTPECSSDE